MNFTGMNYNSCGSGCNDGCPTTTPTYQQCNQVVQTCNVEDIPHYIDYHTHVVNNFVKRHVNIPTYSTSSENVVYNEYVQGQPMVQQPIFYPQYPQQQMMPGQYQGNVGTDPFVQQPTTPNVSPQNFQGFIPPMGNVPFGF